MRNPKVLLTNPIHPAVLPQLESACEVLVAPDTSAATLREQVGDVEGLIGATAIDHNEFVAWG